MPQGEPGVSTVVVQAKPRPLSLSHLTLLRADTYNPNSPTDSVLEVHGMSTRLLDLLVRRITLLAMLLAVPAAFSQAPASAPSHEVVIKNAVVMTVTHGNIKNGSIYIKD